MNRRKFLTTSAIAAPAALAAPAIGRAQAKHEWKLVTSLPANLPGPGVSAQRWADRITRMSGGEIDISVFAAGELVPPFGTQEAVENGTAQAYHGSGSWFSGRDISHAFFFSAPFGLTFDEMHAWMYYGGGQELLDEFTNPRGLQVFIGGGSGVQTFGWFKKPINSLDDLRGLNFRITGFGASVLNKIGMNAVSTPPGEIFPALQSGALDGAEWVGPSFDQAFGFQKIMSHMYAPSFADVYGGIEFGINLDAWNALSEELQTIVITATEAEANRSSADALNMNMDGLDALKEVEGLTIDTLPGDVWDALRTASHEVMDEVAGTSGFVSKLMDSYYGYVKRASEYKRLYDVPLYAQREKYIG
ncbi:TRAP transporter substrate-binding protein [Chelativorans salis]|uniref:TRAP transporter substrate-binding protein n=1 Tax=Chelativorans salis TaxID=2978478 RepID=A0ABT2LTN7_9HYPH|nr:TRAP transporter substrate-binding protein [Chelativorans sp. EGI FJ00035]MCT7377906.1 TRAP transporter substrate-binding protein [Chelativorans sp. EGI FJ00035]